MSILTNPAKTLAERIRECNDALTGMRGKRLACIAMIHLTGEAIYSATLSTTEKAIRKSKAFISAATAIFNTKARIERKYVAYQLAKTDFELMCKLMDRQMYPSREKRILEELKEMLAKHEKKSVLAEPSVKKTHNKVANEKKIEAMIKL